MKEFIKIVQQKDGYNKIFDKHLAMIQSALNNHSQQGVVSFIATCFDNKVQIYFLNENRDALCIHKRKILYMNKDIKEAKDIQTFKINFIDIDRLINLCFAK